MGERNLIDRGLREIVVCPACGGDLAESGTGLFCAPCDAVYACDVGVPLDLRLRQSKRVELIFTVPDPAHPDIPVVPLQAKHDPEVDFSGVKIPHHMTRELLSYFPRASSDSARVLDLGCGNTVHKPVCEKAGFTYVGLDYSAPEAPIWGDAHALPFKDESFDFILSIAVAEHIQYPFVMIKEVSRVLKPGGKFIGTVAFLEPFHGNSYYHHSHLGTFNLLRYGALTVERIGSSMEWTGLDAQASMALFRGIPGPLKQASVAPIKWASRAWWELAGVLGKGGGQDQLALRTSGAFSFVAAKPDTAAAQDGCQDRSG